MPVFPDALPLVVTSVEMTTLKALSEDPKAFHPEWRVGNLIRVPSFDAQTGTIPVESQYIIRRIKHIISTDSVGIVSIRYIMFLYRIEC